MPKNNAVHVAAVVCPIAPGDILTPQQLAERLQVPLSWIYEKSRRRQQQPLPTFRIGKYIRFSWVAVSIWLQSTSGPNPRKIPSRDGGAAYKRSKAVAR